MSKLNYILYFSLVILGSWSSSIQAMDDASDREGESSREAVHLVHYPVLDQNDYEKSTKLDDDVLLHIFSYLTPKDLCQVSLVCRQFYCLSGQNVLWKRHLQLDEISEMTDEPFYKNIFMTPICFQIDNQYNESIKVILYEKLYYSIHLNIDLKKGAVKNFRKMPKIDEVKCVLVQTQTGCTTCVNVSPLTINKRLLITPAAERSSLEIDPTNPQSQSPFEILVVNKK